LKHIKGGTLIRKRFIFLILLILALYIFELKLFKLEFFHTQHFRSDQVNYENFNEINSNRSIYVNSFDRGLLAKPPSVWFFRNNDEQVKMDFGLLKNFFCFLGSDYSGDLFLTDESIFGNEKVFIYYYKNSNNYLSLEIVNRSNCSPVANVYINQSNSALLIFNKMRVLKNDVGSNKPGRMVSFKNSIMIVDRLGNFSIFDPQTKVIRQIPRKGFPLIKKEDLTPESGIKGLMILDDSVLVSKAIQEKNCKKLEVDSINFDSNGLILTLTSEFQKLYSSPCSTNKDDALNVFAGKILRDLNNPGSIILSVGNSNIYTGSEPYKYIPNLGLILRIDTRNGNTEIISSGHRNPQGMCFQNQKLYSVEHGPDGGDELNEIIAGGDYGWPNVSYGFPYGFDKLNSNGRNFGTHFGFKQPKFAWVPSIAPSSILCPDPNRFENWSEDFLITTLKDQSIHRLRLVQDNFVFDERIQFDERLRDIVPLGANTFYILTDSGNLIHLMVYPRNS